MTMKARYTVVDGEVIAEKRNGVRHELVPDQLGSTRALLDNTQTQVATWTYWPFGEVAASTGTVTTPLQFVGTKGYYNDSSNRTYVRARHLRTDLARWMTPDPIGFDGDDYNLYRYVGNNPSTNTDETGLKCDKPPKHSPPVFPIPPGLLLPKGNPVNTCSGGTQTIVAGACKILLKCGLVVGLLCFSEQPAGNGGDLPPEWRLPQKPKKGKPNPRNTIGPPSYDPGQEPAPLSKQQCLDEYVECQEKNYVQVTSCQNCYDICEAQHYWPNRDCYPRKKKRR